MKLDRVRGATGTHVETIDLVSLCGSLSERSPLPLVAVEGLTHLVRYVNPAFCRLTGKNKEDLLGKPFGIAVPESESNRCLALFANVYRTGGEAFLADQEHRLATSQLCYWSYAAWAILDINDQPAGVMVQVTDSTQTMLLQQTAKAMNQELLISGLKQHEMTEAAKKLNVRLERAVQETHHRVKNNLQVVSALVELQIGDAAGVADTYLRRIHRHIRTLTTVHDLLTQQSKVDDKATRVSVTAMLEELLSQLQELSGGRHITISLAELMLPVEGVAALSLLVNECVSNAVKHARGEIEITLRVVNDQAYLEVCDDGAGFPLGFDPVTAAHTGLDLIESMARFDLDGNVRYENRPQGGGRVVVTFPIDLAPQK